MRFLSIFWSLALLLTAAIGGCASDNLQDLTESPGVIQCDTAFQATYALRVQPIINKYGCAAANCHATGGTGTASTGFNYETVVGFQAANRTGQLLGAIEHRSPYSPMPKAGAKMDECDILTIKRWVKAGAKND